MTETAESLKIKLFSNIDYLIKKNNKKKVIEIKNLLNNLFDNYTIDITKK